MKKIADKLNEVGLSDMGSHEAVCHTGLFSLQKNAFISREESNADIYDQANPSQYAEKLGTNFALSKEKPEIASLGQYFTPQLVAELMAENFFETIGSSISILDPGAGTGILSTALVEKISTWKSKPKHIELTAYEIDKSLIPLLERSLHYLKDWLSRKNISLSFSICNDDFVLANAAILDKALQQSLFDTKDFEKFDLIVANPPYFKISKSDLRAKAASSIVHGQPNIYALFMAVAASLLKEKGQLGFITPRSYASGLYFKKFRQDFFRKITPISIHVFESRDKPFSKDKVLQENVILHAQKHSIQGRQNHSVKISSCDGLSDIEYSNVIEVPLEEIISIKDDSVLHIPTKSTHREIVRIVRSWKHNLDSLGLSVSTGPIVPFRSRSFLRDHNHDESNAPLLWLQNVKAMKVNWPLTSRKPQYVSREAMKLLLRNNNYVLVRRFSAKEEQKRLVAAPLIAKIIHHQFIGIENHLNYIYCKTGALSEAETIGLAAVLNCSLLDSYFRIFNGNTQVSATELRSMPLPPRQVIEKIGLAINDKLLNLQEIDERVINLIEQYA